MIFENSIKSFAKLNYLLPDFIKLKYFRKAFVEAEQTSVHDYVWNKDGKKTGADIKSVLVLVLAAGKTGKGV